MLRSGAIGRINFGLGFRSSTLEFDSTIAIYLQEAQRDLERGKTLPRFLLIQDFQTTEPAGQLSMPYPDGFARESDETRLRITSAGGVGLTKPVFLERRYFIDAIQAFRDTTRTEAPKVYVARPNHIRFPNATDKEYVITMDFYKQDAVLSVDIENKWLAFAPDWLIGEAGWRIAMDMERPNAVQKFDALRKAGRAAIFGEDVAFELAAAPLQMGANS